MSLSATANPDRAPNPAEKPPRPRPWIPLSLKIFVIVQALVAGVGLTWLGVRDSNNRAAFYAISRLVGTLQARQKGPSWLRSFLAHDRFLAIDEITAMKPLNCSARYRG